MRGRTDHLSGPDDVLGFARCQPHGSDYGEHLVVGQLREPLRGWRQPEELLGHLVHFPVGRLRAEDHRDEECEVVWALNADCVVYNSRLSVVQGMKAAVNTTKTNRISNDESKVDCI